MKNRLRSPRPGIGSAATVVTAGLLCTTLAGCGTGTGTGATDGQPAPDDTWRSTATAVADQLTRGADTPQTIAPDPTVNTPPDTISALAVIPAPVPEVRDRLTEAAVDQALDEPVCADLTRARAFELLAENDDTPPRQATPSALCTLTREGQQFGFVLLASLAGDSTRAWYDLGPDGTPPTP